MKKNETIDVKRVILCPDFVRSKSDGDRHFISASMLARLYGVLPTDIVRVKNSSKPEMPQDQMLHEGWVELWPRYEGDYYNIHSPALQVSQNKNFKF